MAVHAGDVPPVIDGRLDEPAWAGAPAATDFIVREPTYGAVSAQRTEVRVLYDGRAIYIGARMFDASPDSIVAQLARRDSNVHSDWFYLGIDSYFDRRTAFVFATNPRGVKADILLYDDRHDNISWDAVWEVATQVDSLGWTAEFRIPLSQLRFVRNGGAERRWGLQFRRDIARSGEVSMWSPVPADASGEVSLFGDLNGLRGLDPPRNLEVLPYVVTQATRSPGVRADPFWRRVQPEMNVGGDVKVGITSNLTVNATLNPDFGQVEADPSVVNLSAFETFLTEKRPFFVEGSNIFDFGIAIGDGSEGLFYSRRIGRSPQGGVPSAAAHSDVPAATTILGAAKLSGRTRRGWSIGLLDAVTAPEHGRYVTDDGTRGEALVEPWTNYLVARVARDHDEGRAGYGAIATTTNRHLDGQLTFLRTAAYTGGFNAFRRFGDHELRGFLVGSHIRGDTAAINRAQRSPSRYWQRPDIEHATYDPLRTTLDGWAGALELTKFGGGHWRYAALVNVRSPGFEPNDLGYMQQADQVFTVAYAGYQQSEATRHVRRWNVNTNHWYVVNFAGERTVFGGNVNGGFTLPSFWGAYAGINWDTPALEPTALRGGPALLRNGSVNAWLNLYSDDRRRVRGRLFASAWREAGTDGRTWDVSPSVTLRLTNSADITLSPSYSRERRAWQFVDRPTVAGVPVYVLAAMDRSTAALTLRANYTMKPALSFQFYGQPFISSGHFDGFMEAAQPRARSFGERFTRYAPEQVAYDARERSWAIDRDGDGVADFRLGNPDFSFKQMRTNAVLRWEYRPGSSLFVVWSHGRTASDPHGDFQLGRDVSDLWSAAGSNVLMVKLSYWLGL